MRQTVALRRSAWVVAALAAAVLAAGVPATPAWDSFSIRWWTDADVIERLGLTKTQIEQIDAIAFDWKEQKIDLKAEVERTELEVWRVLDEDVIDQAAAETAIDRMVDARCALERAEQEHRLAVAQVLTREQRRELMRMKEEFKHKMMRKWKRSSKQSKKELGPSGTDPSSP